MGPVPRVRPAALEAAAASLLCRCIKQLHSVAGGRETPCSQCGLHPRDEPLAQRWVHCHTGLSAACSAAQHSVLPRHSR